MKRKIFTLLIVIAGSMIATTAYSQVSIHANINLGRPAPRVFYPAPPVVYQPSCNDHGYARGRTVVVVRECDRKHWDDRRYNEGRYGYDNGYGNYGYGNYGRNNDRRADDRNDRRDYSRGNW